MAHLRQKHYEKIAQIIRKYRSAPVADVEDRALAFSIAFDLADYFERENSKFNREKFLKLAGCW